MEIDRERYIEKRETIGAVAGGSALFCGPKFKVKPVFFFLLVTVGNESVYLGFEKVEIG